MIVYVQDDYEAGYYITTFPEGAIAVDVTQKFLDRYNAYEAEKEFIQSKLHDYCQEAKRHEILKQSEKGIPSKGF